MTRPALPRAIAASLQSTPRIPQWLCLKMYVTEIYDGNMMVI